MKSKSYDKLVNIAKKSSRLTDIEKKLIVTIVGDGKIGKENGMYKLLDAR